MCSDGLRPLAAAMTILLTDYGGTTPAATCEEIAYHAPSLYRAWGFRRVLAACEEIQHSDPRAVGVVSADVSRVQHPVLRRQPA